MTEQVRSSFALALQDYRGIRPGIAITVAAIALVAAIAIGLLHIVQLGHSGATLEDGRRTMRALHSYNAALEVWRKMATTPDAETMFPVMGELRDSIATALQLDLTELQTALADTVDQKLVGEVLADLSRPERTSTAGTELGIRGRAAMIVLTARQDSAMFRTAGDFQRSQFHAAVLIGLAVIAAGVLIIPMSWVYVRFKRGQPI
jgi:hypothetical protein